MDYNELNNKPTINGFELTQETDVSDIGFIEISPEMVSELFLETFGVILQ